MSFKPVSPLFVDNTSTSKFNPVSPKKMAELGTSNPRVINLLATFDSPTGILDYGADIMSEIAKKSDQLLLEVKDADVDFVEQQLTSILTLANSFNINSKSDTKVNKVIKSIKNIFVSTKEQIKAEFNDISTQMDRTVNEIDLATTRLSQKLPSLQQQYQENLNEYRKLDQLIKDAEEVYQIKSDELAKAQTNNLDMLLAQEISRSVKNLERLEKKIDYLKKYQMMAIQNAPSITQMEDNAITLLQKFHDIKTMTIPLWKRQIRMYIDGQDLNRSANLANAIDNANNSLIKTNSDAVSQNSIEAAKLSQRSLIDDTTIEHVHQNLINTLADISNINAQGKTARINSANKMEEMKKMYASISASHSFKPQP